MSEHPSFGDYEREAEDQLSGWDSRDDRLEDCWQCGGEGYVYDCFDGFCVNAEDGCELCMTRCDVCNPAPRPAQPSSEPPSKDHDNG